MRNKNSALAAQLEKRKIEEQKKREEEERMNKKVINFENKDCILK
jgi:hypothetical protein